MSPMFRSARKQDLKRTIKYLGVCTDPKIQSLILQKAPDSVYKAIFNAAFNVAENPEILISPKQKKVFTKHKRGIRFLIRQDLSFKKKRKAIQKGGAFPLLAAVLPTLLSTAISVLGSAFINRVQKQEEN